MTEWRYIAQRVLTGEFLDMDLRIDRDDLAWTLSGAGSLRGTISPDVGRLRAPDGRLVLEEWGTLLYAEANGQIRWGGIIISSAFAGETWTIEAAGFATYPNGLPYDNAMSWTQTDPTVPFKELWANAQWRPNAHLGVLVVADDTTARVGLRGTDGNNGPIGVGDVTDEKWAELILAGWTAHEGTLFPPERIYYPADPTGAGAAAVANIKRLIDDESWVEEKLYNLTDGDTFIKAEGLSAEKIAFIQSYGWKAETKDVTNDKQDNPVPGYSGPAWVEKTPRWIDPPKQEIDPAPYSLSWWETPDIGAKLDELAKQAPFDYIEHHFWEPEDSFVDVGEGQIDGDVYAWLLAFGWYGKADDGLERLYRPDYLDVSENTTIAAPVFEYLMDHGWAGRAGDKAERIYRPADASPEIAHVVRIFYPRAGRRRDDLAFIQGDNIIEVVAPTLDGDEYANSVTGLGAGEGIAALRRETSVNDGRLYRGYVYSDKSITDIEILNSRIKDELAYRRNLLEISSITVRDHPHARIGDWALGDDIFVQSDLPWLGEVSLWCRITGWSLLTEDTATLTLARSDSFRYGG